MEELLKQAQLGIEAQAFLTTELGKFLLQKSDNELDEAYQQLLTVKPSDTDALLQWQGQAQTAIHFKQWLSEAILTGNYAESELKDG